MAADTFQIKRGTTAAVAAYLPAIGEPVYDLTLKKLYIGDGVTMGGVESTPTNANLVALAGLTGAADRGFYFTGAGAMSLFTLTPVARTLAAATTVAAQRTALGSTVVGDALFITASAAAARTTLGSTAVGDAVFTAVDATAARSTLGLVIGTNVQQFDSDLAAVAALAANGSVHRTGTGTMAVRTLTGTANKITVTNGDGVAGNPTVTIPDAVTLVTPTVTGLLNSTGGQIQFPAVQVPSANANTLDDYEEGTFTPTITFSTPGDLAVTYSLQAGAYTKIGRQVFWSIALATATFTHTTAAGTLTIAGLPFAVSGNPVVSMGRWRGITSAIATPQINGIMNGSTVIFEVMNVAAGTESTLGTANAPTGVQKNFLMSGTYNV